MADSLWLTPFICVPTPGDDAELRYSQEAVEHVFDFFALLVYGQNDWAGKPFQLLPWEEQFIREFFGVQVKNDKGQWVRYRRFGYDEIPKRMARQNLMPDWGCIFCWQMARQSPM